MCNCIYLSIYLFIYLCLFKKYIFRFYCEEQSAKSANVR